MILSGKQVAEKIYSELKNKISQLKNRSITPTLAVILAGDDPASLSYVKIKEKVAQNLGIGFELFQFGANETPEKIENLIKNLNAQSNIHGIIVQLPLPTSFQTDEILKLIDPKKDVDGFLGLFHSATAEAILEILNFYKIDYRRKKIALVGHGRLVGQPLSDILISQGIEPLVCDSSTKDLAKKVREADILISATGVPEIIKPDMVKDGAIIIDAGTAEANGKIVGDISGQVYKKDISYTPTPGGVGPVTVAVLMSHVVEAAEKYSY